MTHVRNENPLHNHEADAGIPWTQDTLAAHVVHLHGVQGLPDGESLASLEAIHGALNHLPARAENDAELMYRVTHPRRRIDRAELGECRWHPAADFPGHQVLELTSGNSTLAVCVEPADLPAVIGALAPDKNLAALRDLAGELAASDGQSEALRELILLTHAAGYRLGVDDMTASGEDLDTVIDILDDERHRITPAQLERLGRVLGQVRVQGDRHG